MACNGCKEKQQQEKSDRQRWDAKAMATISEAIGATRLSHPALSARLLKLVAELNEIGMKEKARLNVDQ